MMSFITDVGLFAPAPAAAEEKSSHAIAEESQCVDGALDEGLVAAAAAAAAIGTLSLTHDRRSSQQDGGVHDERTIDDALEEEAVAEECRPLEPAPSELLREMYMELRASPGLNQTSTGGQETDQVPIKFDHGYAILQSSWSDDCEDILSWEPRCNLQLLKLVDDNPRRYAEGLIHIGSREDVKVKIFRDPEACGVQELKIAKRKELQRAFTGNQAVVEVDDDNNGKVVGVVRAATDDNELRFVCTASAREREEEHRGSVLPTNPNMPRLYTLIRQCEAEYALREKCIGVYKLVGNSVVFSKYVKIAETTNTLLVVKYLCWRPGMKYPVGIVIDTDEITADSISLARILYTSFGIQTEFTKDQLNEASKIYRHFNSTFDMRSTVRRDLTALSVFTVDSVRSKDLDDAISLEKLHNCYRIGVHIADAAHFVQQGSCLDAEAFRRVQTLYPGPHRDHEPLIRMLPDYLSVDVISLNEKMKRFAVSYMFCIDEDGQLLNDHCESFFGRSIITSKRKLTYGKRDDRDLERLCELVQLLMKTKNPPNPHSVVQHLMEHYQKKTLEVLLDAYPDCTPVVVNSKAFEQQSETKRTNRTLPFGKFTSSSDHVPKADASNQVSILKRTWLDIRSSLTKTDVENACSLIQNATSHLAQWQADTFAPDGKLKKNMYMCSKYLTESMKATQPRTTCTSPMRSYVDLVTQRLLIACLEGSETPPYTPEELRDICEHCTLMEYTLEKHQQELNSLSCAVLLKKRASYAFPMVERCSDWCLTIRFPSFHYLPPEVQLVGYNIMGLCCSPELRNGSASLEWRQIIYDVKQASVRSGKRSDARIITLPNATSGQVVKVDREHWQRIVGLAHDATFDELKREIALLKIASEQEHVAEISSEMWNLDDQEPCDHFVKFVMKFQPGSLLHVQMTAEVKAGTLQPQIQLLCLAPKLHICIEHQANPLRCFVVEHADEASKDTYESVDEYKQSWMTPVIMDAVDNAVSQQRGATIHGVNIIWLRNEQGKLRGKFTLTEDFCSNRHIYFNPTAKRTLQQPMQSDGPQESDEDEENEMLTKECDYDLVCVRYMGDVDSEIARVAFADEKKVDYTTICWVGHCVTTGVIRRQHSMTVYLRLHFCSSDFPEELLQRGKQLPCTIEWMPIGIPDMRRQAGLNGLSGASDFVHGIGLGTILPTTNAENGTAEIEEVVGFQKLNKDQRRAVQASMDSEHRFVLIQGPPGTGKTTTGAYVAYLLAKQNRPGDKVLVCGPTNAAVDVMTLSILRSGAMCPKILRVYGEDMEREDFPLPWTPKYPLRFKQTQCELNTADKEILGRVTLHYRIRGELNPFSHDIRQFDELFKHGKSSVTRKDIAEYLKVVFLAQKYELNLAEIILCTCTAAGSPRMDKIGSLESCSEPIPSTNVDDEDSDTGAFNSHTEGSTAADDDSATYDSTTTKVQLIIDEAGMCTEPDTMIPLVAHSKSLDKLILIGDHKQLQPIIMCHEARRAKLNISLFERYARRSGVTVMLKEQYRMHEAICEFPSTQFYESMLCVAEQKAKHQRQPNYLGGKLWPGGPKVPIVFCDLRGRENTQFVSTSEAAEQSKSNKMEADLALYLAKFLTERITRNRQKPADDSRPHEDEQKLKGEQPGGQEHATKPRNQPKETKRDTIAIITFYRAQKVLLESLRSTPSDVDIRTAVLSQGNEWDYVILSCVRSASDNDIQKCPETTSHMFVGWKRRHLGFLCDYNQVNVALTRAKKGLIIIGNRALLECDDVWAKLLEHYRDKRAVVDGRRYKTDLQTSMTSSS